MKIFIFFFMMLGSLHADPFEWSPSEPIDVSVASFENVATCYDSLHDRMIVAWIDLITDIPTYSIYQNGAWSAPGVIDSTAVGLRNVYLCYNPELDQVVATWNETSGPDYYPAYSVYSNGSWSAASLINTNIPMVGGDVYPCYNPNNHTVVATWGSDTAAPVYAVFNGTSWSVPAFIPSGGVANLNIYSCFNSATNQVMAVWADGPSSMYSLFDGTVWTTPLSIALTGNPANVFVSYNASSNQTFATWVDSDNNDYPTYSIYDGTSWSSPAVIASESVIGFVVTLFSCYDSLHNQIFVTWPGILNCDPIYSIYSNGVWSTPAFINVSPPGVIRDIYLTYNPSSDEIFATWTDCETSAPYFSIYQDTAPYPPTHLSGVKRANKFASQTDWYNQLDWQPPAIGSTPVAYLVYRDNLNTLIGVIPANGPLTYLDHNRQRRKTYTYYVTSVFANGSISAPAMVVIK